ncbi:MAG: hypothetical protein ACFCUI_12710 [Bernardetiaceae bacterium]
MLQIINTPFPDPSHQGYQVQTAPMTPEDRARFQDVSRDSWKPPAAILSLFAIIFISLALLGIPVSIELISGIGFFGLVVLVLTIYQRFSIQRDRIEDKKEIITATIDSRSERYIKTGADRIQRLYYFLESQGQQISVCQEVYQHIQAGDVYQVEQGRHSKQKIQERIYKSHATATEVSSDSPEPTPLTAQDKALVGQLYQRILKHTRRHTFRHSRFMLLFVFVFYAVFLWLIGDTGVFVPALRWFWLWCLLYWVLVAVWLDHTINKKLRLWKADTQTDYVFVAKTVFVDKIRSGDSHRERVLVVSPTQSIKSIYQTLLVMDQRGICYALGDTALFERVALQQPYTLRYLPNSHAWLSLTAPDGRGLYP